MDERQGRDRESKRKRCGKATVREVKDTNERC